MSDFDTLEAPSALDAHEAAELLGLPETALENEEGE